MGDVHVEVFNSFDDVSISNSEWDDFIASVSGEIFLTCDWCRTWWKYYGDDRNLMIYIFRDSHRQLCGILPVFSESFGFGPAAVSVVKMVGTDFMPITLTIPVREDQLEMVTSAFLDSLSIKCQWDLLYLGAICGGYSHIDCLVAAIYTGSNSRFDVNLVSNEVQIYFDVANSWDEQVAGLSQKQRQNVRRVYKELERQSLTPEYIPTSKSDFLETFSTFVQVHQQQWSELGMPGHFVDWPYSVEFHRELGNIGFDKDRTRLFKIKLNDKVIGYDYIYKFGRSYQWYLMGRSHYENDSKVDFQRISFGLKIQSAIRDGVTSIDAGRGRYEYKLAMGGKLTSVHNVFVESRTFLSKIKLSAFYLLIWVSNILYSKVWRRRVVPRLGLRPSPLWCWWIKTNMLARIGPAISVGKLNNSAASRSPSQSGAN